MSVDEFIQKIQEKSGLDEDEIRERIESKRNELNDLITLEGAAHIVAGELGINFLGGIVETPKLKLENVIPGMSSVDVVGRLAQLFELRTFEKSEGGQGKVVSGIISDDTAALRIVFWDENAVLIEKGELKEGDLIRLRDGYSKENRNGEAEIHVGNRAWLLVNPEDIDPDEFRSRKTLVKLSELVDGMPSVDTAVKVLRIYEPREFKREDGSTGKVVNLLVADETGSSRLVLWDDDVGFVEKGEISQGDVLKVKKGYVRMRLNEPEVHVGRYGKIVLNPPDVELKDVKEQEFASLQRFSISEIKPGLKAEIRGALVKIYDNPTIYERDGEKRLVVNGVLDDGTGRLHCVFFNKMGEEVLNTTINAVVEGDFMSLVMEREKELVGREVVLSGNVRQSEQTGRIELIVFDIDLNPDPKVEIERLLKESGSHLGEGNES